MLKRYLSLLEPVLCYASVLLMVMATLAKADSGIESKVDEILDLEKPPTLTVPFATVTPTPLGHSEALDIEPAVVTKRRLKSANVVNSISFKNALNLSLPFKAEEVNDDENGSKQPLNIFAPSPKNRNDAVRLDGTVIMTPELEAEKRKTFDGAGIAINVKP